MEKQEKKATNPKSNADNDQQPGSSQPTPTSEQKQTLVEK